MALDEESQRQFEQIERGLLKDDPVLAAKLDNAGEKLDKPKGPLFGNQLYDRLIFTALGAAIILVGYIVVGLFRL